MIALVTDEWRSRRLAWAIVAAGSTLATIGWRGTTRPMGDTADYGLAARLLEQGWPSLPDRTPGYPTLLLLTGSTDGVSRLLFVVQLAMHLVTVGLVLRLGGRLGLGPRGAAVLAALLMAPPVMLRVVYAGTEALCALLLTGTFWLLVASEDRTLSTKRAAAIGVACGLAGLVRPSFAALFVPVAAIVLVRQRPRFGGNGGPWAHLAAAIALPTVILVGGLSLYNGIRFDSPGLTPLTAYHLSSKTSPYVENLPASYEPARSVLIRYRDRALLEGESAAPGNFIWKARPALAEATGKQGRALDRYVLEMDLVLISQNPYAYLETVKTATVNFTTMDSQPAVLGVGRPVVWVEQAVHVGLTAAFLVATILMPGLAVAGRLSARHRQVLSVGAILVLYVAAVSVMFETGTARLRAPTEPVLAVLFVLAASIAWREVRSAATGTMALRHEPAPISP